MEVKQGEMGQKQYAIFLKYQRGHLSQATGYSRGHLSRIATGAKPPSKAFIGVCAHSLSEPAEELFRLLDPQAARLAPPTPPGQKNQDLFETIDELAWRLTTAEKKIDKLEAELEQYG
ncbi:hypothetical protein ES703_103288 [subsurface metagenome]|jgi:transcriptional regulator with XRE-family HTH domain